MIRRIARKIREDGFSGLWSSVSTRFRHSRIGFRLYKVGILSHDTIYGSEYYEDRDREAAQRDAEQFAETVLDRYSPESILELGCGTGTLLYPYRDRGIHVRGVDLSKTAREESDLSESEFEIHDLTQPYTSSRKYDIVLCVEVLEHIPPEAADTIVESISTAGNVAVVTAAPPGQGGTHHVNEQPREYWIQKFERENMSYREEISANIAEDLGLSELTWIENNILVFESN